MNTSSVSSSNYKPPRPNVLNDPASLAAIQARLRERNAAAEQQHQQHQINSSSATAADGTSISAAGSLLYSGMAGRTNSPSVVANASQCRSLRDRIYERTLSRSPLPPTASGGVQYNYNGTKDVYAHEQPFPVQTVFEVQRIGNPIPEDERPQSASAPELRQSDTILTDVESAALIQTLEAKLNEKVANGEAKDGEIAELRAKVADLEGQIEGFKTSAEEATTRLTEAQAQCEAARQSIVTAVDNERVKFQAEADEKEAAVKTEYEKKLADLRTELDAVKSSVSIKDDDQSSLFVLIADLQKAVREGAERQKKNAEVISRLDKELQESRARAATVSTGFHAKEKVIRDANEKIELLTNQVNSLESAKEELTKTQEQLASVQKQLEEATSELVPLRVTADEKTRFQNQCQSLESELSRKNEELQQLRNQVEGVRQQADAVYARSSNFRGAVDNSGNNNNQQQQQINNSNYSTGYPMGGANANNTNTSSYSALPLTNNSNVSNAGNGSSDDAMKQLRADIMAEDARTEAERQKWKSGQ